MKIIVYSLGQRFKSLFIDDDFVVNVLKYMNYEIEYLYDKKYVNQIYEFKNQKYSIISLDKIEKKEKYKIVVTSKDYYEEIKKELLEQDFVENQICLLDDILENYLNIQYNIDLFDDKCGIEIGGPSKIFSNIYTICQKCDGVNFSDNTVWWKKDDKEKYVYEGLVLGQTYIADAVNMECIQDECYDFVLSSNNLEHIANPMKALSEFKRILRREGLLLLVVPIKYKIFDHNREFTSFEHLLEDYNNRITEDDMTHLEEIIQLHDYDMDVGCGGKHSFIERAKLNIENRCLHHHVFSEESLKKMFGYFDIKVVNFFVDYNNYCIIGKKV